MGKNFNDVFARLCQAMSLVLGGIKPPGSGKDIAEGKGVHCEVESEGSWMRETY